MITFNESGSVNVGWVQNGIKLKRKFKSIKEAERFQEVVDDAQNAMRLAEEMERFNRDFKYDPKLVELKNADLGKEIEEMKERIRLKQTLQKKLDEAQSAGNTSPACFQYFFHNELDLLNRVASSRFIPSRFIGKLGGLLFEPRPKERF